jgi:hypothetical protein
MSCDCEADQALLTDIKNLITTMTGRIPALGTVNGEICVWDGTRWEGSGVLLSDLEAEDDELWAALAAINVLGTVLTGLTTGTNTPLTTSDTVLSAFQNLQAQISARGKDINYHRKAGTSHAERWYTGSATSGGSITSITNVPANTLMATPVIITRPTTIDRLGVRVFSTNSDGTAVVRVGLYNSSNDVYPNALIVDSGDLPATSVATVTSVINQTLQPGLYWLVLANSSNTGTSPGLPSMSASVFPPVLGVNTAFSTNAGCLWHAFTWGALPTTFPSTAYSYIGAGNMPLAFYRVSSQS